MAKDKKFYPEENIFDAKAATGVSGTVFCGDFRHVQFDYGTTDSATMTIKVLVAMGETPPDFSSAASATNRYNEADYALSDNGGAITDGDTGIVFSGTDGVGYISVNVDGADWAALKITAYTQGTITATCLVREN